MQRSPTPSTPAFPCGTPRSSPATLISGPLSTTTAPAATSTGMASTSSPPTLQAPSASVPGRVRSAHYDAGGRAAEPRLLQRRRRWQRLGACVVEGEVAHPIDATAGSVHPPPGGAEHLDPWHPFGAQRGGPSG